MDPNSLVQRAPRFQGYTSYVEKDEERVTDLPRPEPKAPTGPAELGAWSWSCPQWESHPNPPLGQPRRLSQSTANRPNAQASLWETV